MKYPHVLGELDTLRLVADGRSLARYGDGELNLCRGARAKAQSFDVKLSWRLQAALHYSGDCLIGIPNLHSLTPKGEFWDKYRETGAGLLSFHQYVSAFVTRPDSAPWVDTPEYWALVESLWLGQRVTLVRGNARSLTAADLHGADVTEVIGPAEDAWGQYDYLLKVVLATNPTRVLLCLGPTATVMAVDLCAKGIHAIDLGHLGMFLRKHRNGEDATVRTEADKVAV